MFSKGVNITGGTFRLGSERQQSQSSDMPLSQPYEQASFCD